MALPDQDGAVGHSFGLELDDVEVRLLDVEGLVLSIVGLERSTVDLATTTYPAEYKGNRVLPVEGRSLLPVLEGGTRPQTVYVWEHEGNRAIRAGDWKLVSRLLGGWELYDIKKDRTETHDLSKDMPEKVAEMEKLYEQWAQRTGVKPWTQAQTPVGWADLTRWTK